MVIQDTLVRAITNYELTDSSQIIENKIHKVKTLDGISILQYSPASSWWVILSRSRRITHCELGSVQIKVSRRQSLGENISILIKGRNIDHFQQLAKDQLTKNRSSSMCLVLACRTGL